MNIKTIGIIGTGAVGLFYGAHLIRSGCRVKFLNRQGSAVLNEHGIQVQSSLEGDWSVSAEATECPEDLKGMDLVLVCLKTTGCDYLARVLPQIVGPQTIVMTLQNGLGNEEEIAKIVPADRIVGGIVFVCLNRIHTGVVQHTAFGHVKAGAFQKLKDDHVLPALKEIFEGAGISFQPDSSIMRLKWEKLIWNIPFNGLSAVLGGVDTQAMLKETGTAYLIRALMEEVVRGALACGVPLDPQLIDDNIEKTLSMGPYLTSMCLDIQQGLPVEVESILGEPLKRAKANGAELPYLECLTHQLRFYNAQNSATDNEPEKARQT